MKFFTNSVILFILLTTIITAQTRNVGIGTTTPNASSILDLTATDMGLLIPRMPTVQRDLIASPATGLLIYNTTDSKFQYYNGTTWITLITAALSSLNGLTGATQTFATGNTGADFNIVSAANAHTFNIPDAAATARGLVSINSQTFAGAKTFNQKVTIDAALGIIETGTTPTFHTIFQGGDQAADLTYTLPTAYPTSNGQVLSATTAGVMSWVSAGSSVAFSSLTDAISTNTIDNRNHSQNWNWSTANNQSTLSLSANAITSGTILDITTTNNALNSTEGLLRVANMGTSTTGIVFRAKSNSTSGTGLTVLASGNVGIGTITPSQRLAVEGSFGILETGTTPTYHSIFQGGDQAADITYTLPTAAPTSNGQVLSATTAGVMSWANVGSGSASISSLTAATATNTIDNANFGQIWNWSSASTQVPMALSANAITTGTILDITTTSGSENSTNGLFRVFNNSTSTNGIVFRAQSNSTAGTGLTVLASGNIGINNAAPGSTLDVKGTIRYSGATSGYVALQAPAAPTSYTLTLPTAVGTNGQVLTTDASGVLSWSTVGSGSASLSSLTSATAVNTINNANWAQTWNWNSATTENPMTLAANSLTTGSILNITSSYASGNSTNGLLYVANTSAGTSGIIFRAQSNSTAGSGLTVYADGNIGVATSTAPTSKLAVNGSLSLPIKTVTADYTLTADDYTILVNVDAATISLPQASTCTGRVYVIKKIFDSSGIITLDPYSSEEIEQASTYIGINARWEAAMIQSDGSAWYILSNRN